MTEMKATRRLRALITGANGFVGPYVAMALREQFGDDVEILGTSRHYGRRPGLGMIQPLDITDAYAVDQIVSKFNPTHVIHLAGMASIRAVVANTAAAWQAHLFGTTNVANAILARAPQCTLIWVGSGQVYGASARSGKALNEEALLAPTNGYEVTKAAADLALGAMALRGLRVLRLRPFNHTGPGQSEEFVVPSFCMQIARIEAGHQPPTLSVGDLNAERDFLDVRDVTRAYALAVAQSDDLPSGTILNIASGVPLRIRDILDTILKKSRVPIEVTQDPERMRPSETPIFVGDSSRAREMLGWSPTRDFQDTLQETYAYCQKRVAQEAELDI